MKDVFAFHLGVKLSKGKIIGFLRLCPIPIYLPQISSQLFLILQQSSCQARKKIQFLWANGVRGAGETATTTKKRLILLPSVWESLAPHLGLVGLLSLMIWKDHPSLWDFLKAFWEIAQLLLLFSPSFYLKRLSLTLEMCVGRLLGLDCDEITCFVL